MRWLFMKLKHRQGEAYTSPLRCENPLRETGRQNDGGYWRESGFCL